MASEDTHSDELAEERPAPGTVVRHRGADVEVRAEGRGPVTVELRRGAAWLRAGAAGPGLVLTHGAATLQVLDGAAVVETHDFEALVVVLAGRASVRGAAALPRTVAAGQAVTLTLDGSSTDPEVLAAGELAADRMVVENLALDALGSGTRTPPDPAPPARSGAQDPGPATPAPVEPPAGPRRGAVDGPPPTAPRPEPSALETALAGVGVVDQGGGDAEAGGDADAGSDEAPVAVGDLDQGDGATGRRRLLVALVIVALIVVAVVAAIVLTADDDADDATPAAAPTSTTAAPGTSTGGASGGTEVPDASAPTGEAQAEVDACRFRDLGFVVRGTVQGGGQDVARYDVQVGLLDADGELYGQAVQRVVPAPDRAEPADFVATVPLIAADVEPDTECVIVAVDALRVGG